MTHELNIITSNPESETCQGNCCCSNPQEKECGSHESNSRREFLQRASTVILGSMSLTLLPMPATNLTAGNVDDAGDQEPGTATSEEKTSNNDGQVWFGFLVDIEKCIGAGKCLTACRIENNVPAGYARTWVERYVHLKDGSVRVDKVPEQGYAGSNLPDVDAELVERAYFVPKLCNHCSDAPCNQVCPVHASITSPEGVELVDPERCIGCAYCVQACPYGVRFINPETNNADKCTWCYHRIMREEQPACVESCPVGARVFGRLDDPNSELNLRLAEVPTHVLKDQLGTNPKLRYVGLSGEVK